MGNDKWQMFKQYMHNELGISKEDIQEWVKKAIEEQAKQMVLQTGYSIKDAVQNAVNQSIRTSYSNNNSINQEIKEIAGKTLAKNIVLSLKSETS